jgi:membrane protease YdiL (CAAX protease family)
MKEKLIAVYTIILFVLSLFTGSIIVNELEMFGIILNYRQIIMIALIVDIIFLNLIIMINYEKINKAFKDWTIYLRLALKKYFKHYLIAIFMMMISNVIIMFFTKTMGSVNEEVLGTMFNISPIYLVFAASVKAPILEELTFRQSFKTLIEDKRIGIVLSGVIFGLLHVISGPDLIYIIPYSIMGIFLAYTMYDTDNVSVPIMFHFLHNTFGVIVKFLI